MAEWLNAAVLKTVRGREAPRGFESFLLRYFTLKITSEPLGGGYFYRKFRHAYACGINSHSNLPAFHSARSRAHLK